MVFHGSCTVIAIYFWILCSLIKNILIQATLGFFALPNEPVDVVNPLIENLITLLCAILLTRYCLFMSFFKLIVFVNMSISLIYKYDSTVFCSERNPIFSSEDAFKFDSRLNHSGLCMAFLALKTLKK